MGLLCRTHSALSVFSCSGLGARIQKIPVENQHFRSFSSSFFLYVRSWAVLGGLGRSWVALGLSWGGLGSVLGGLGSLLEVLGRFWATLGRSWVVLGDLYVVLGWSWDGLEVVLDHFRSP